MSGPKRGSWTYVYDPTPQRLDDLGQFAARQEEWLARHGAFIERYGGAAALAEARAAYDQVQECIDAGDPDGGFSAYGAAWVVFNGLHRQAADAKRRQEYEQRLRQQEAAALLAECRSAWRAAETQDLLRRWAGSTTLSDLSANLDEVAALPAAHVPQRARAWLAQLQSAVDEAEKEAQRNARAVKAEVPKLHAALRAADQLHIAALPEADRQEFGKRKDRLRQAGERALSDEDLTALRSAIRGLARLGAEYEPRVKAAEFAKASAAWRTALARCGYDVVARTEPDGTIVLKATGFPMKSATVQLSNGSDQVKLHVGDAHDPDHARCVTDVRALQAELAREGVGFTVTDWGSGQPGSAQERTTLKLGAGGQA